MDIDIYQQCPCHTEKKIKFCCGKDIVSDLNQVLSKNSAGQSQAALDQLERTIKKTGPRDCLLTIQTHILISNGEIEKAKQSNLQFLEKNPKHSTGLHHRALIELAEGRTLDAVNSLQDAMEAIPGNEIPISLANAFRMIGLALLSDGHLVGARSHLRYASALKGGNDEQLQRMIYETFRIPNAPLLLKFDFNLPEVPEDQEWSKWFRNAHLCLDRGQFRRAMRFLKKIDENHPDLPKVLRGIAILHLSLGNLDEIAPAWRRYSELPDLPELEAIEAEAIAQLFTPDDEKASLDIVRVTLELADADDASEKAISHPRLASIQRHEVDPFEEGPPPRNSFYFLDRDELSSSQDATIDTIPEVAGELLLFGKQTDRPARLEIVCTRKEDFEANLKQLQEILGSTVVGEPKIQVMAQSNAIENAFSWSWHLPRDTTAEQHANWVKQKRRQALIEKWSHLKIPALGMKSPREAAGDESLLLKLKAMLLANELMGGNQFGNDEGNTELREELGIAPIESVKLEQFEPSQVSPVKQIFLDYQELNDEELVAIHMEAVAIGNFNVLRKSIPAILERPECEFPRESAYATLAHITEDNEQALEYLSLARKEAKAKEQPIGQLLVQEFEMRLVRGLTEKLPELLNTIQMHHLGEPDVQYSLEQVLDKYGLLQRSDPSETAPTQDYPPAAESSPIWTPGSDAKPTPEPAASQEEASKLWIPE